MTDKLSQSITEKYLTAHSGAEAEQTRSNSVCLMKRNPQAAFTFSECFAFLCNFYTLETTVVFHLFFSLGRRSVRAVVRGVFALVMKCSHIMFAQSSAWWSMN